MSPFPLELFGTWVPFRVPEPGFTPWPGRQTPGATDQSPFDRWRLSLERVPGFVLSCSWWPMAGSLRPPRTWSVRQVAAQRAIQGERVPRFPLPYRGAL